MDNLWAFFQNAWHWKDWVKNDSSIPEKKKTQIVQAAEKSDVLQICADLANRSKHLRLETWSSRMDADVTGRNIIIVMGENSSSKVTHNVALGDGTVLTAQDVAEHAVDEWSKILASAGAT